MHSVCVGVISKGFGRKNTKLKGVAPSVHKASGRDGSGGPQSTHPSFPIVCEVSCALMCYLQNISALPINMKTWLI